MGEIELVNSKFEKIMGILIVMEKRLPEKYGAPLDPLMNYLSWEYPLGCSH